MSDFVLETNNLSKRYTHFQAVTNVNLHVRKGAIYGLIGRNGAGKTTLLKMLSGLARPTYGEIVVFGKSYLDLRPFHSRIGSMIDLPGLYTNMTAYENMKLKCIFMGIRDDNCIEALLNTVGLKDVLNKKVSRFSFGMKQRLGVAMALIGNPDILILDEPTNGLDPQGMADFRKLFLDLSENKNTTIILSSHILDEIGKVATDIGIMQNGMLLREMSGAELRRNCAERIELTVKDPSQVLPVLDALSLDNYKVTDMHHISIYDSRYDSGELNTVLIRRNISVDEIRVCCESLESFFLHLTGDAK